MVIMSDIFHVKWNRTDPPKVQINTALTWHTKNGQMYHHTTSPSSYIMYLFYSCVILIFFVNNNTHLDIKYMK